MITMVVIIKESYIAYKNKVDALAHHDANWGYLKATARKWRNNSIKNAMQFFKMQFFWAALPGNICKVVAHIPGCNHNPERSWSQASKKYRRCSRGEQQQH
jgi:hypothetical protein